MGKPNSCRKRGLHAALTASCKDSREVYAMPGKTYHVEKRQVDQPLAEEDGKRGGCSPPNDGALVAALLKLQPQHLSEGVTAASFSD